MVDKAKNARLCSKNKEASFIQGDASLLFFDAPDVEEIAKAIWERQRDALVPGSFASKAKWRDSSIPSKFWDEYLLDANAVLSLLYKKRIEYQNRCKSVGECDALSKYLT